MNDNPRSELPPKPRLAIRVGITGARDLGDGNGPGAVVARARDVLRFIKEHLGTLGREPAIEQIYADSHSASLVLLSPLADGADRLVAKAALQEGYQLRAVLPFDRFEYHQDFERDQSRPEFDELLASATAGVIELDGARGPYLDASYEAAGHIVARNCDLMIAVWDGNPGRGRGGTEAILRYALRIGVPVWWLPLDGDAPGHFVTGTRSFVTAADATGGEALLGEYLARLIRPPNVAPTHRLNIWERLVHVRHRLAAGPLHEYLSTVAPDDKWYWRAYSVLVRCLAGLPVTPFAEPPAETFWHIGLNPADLRATAFGTRVRSVYIWVAALTALSVGLAVWVPAFEVKGDAAAVIATGEFAALLVIWGLMLRSRWKNWNQRWRDYRRLAELFRAQQALMPMGETLQTWIRLVYDGQFPVPTDESQWVNWLFAAMTRMAPVGDHRFNAESLVATREILIAFLERQYAYHDGVAKRTIQADGRSVLIDLSSFLVVLLLVAVKIWVSFATEPTNWAKVLEVCVAFLPVLAINFAGIRAAIRFRLQADKSHSMRDAIKRSMQQLNQIELKRPLASQDISFLVRNISTHMIQDADARLAVGDD